MYSLLLCCCAQHICGSIIISVFSSFLCQSVSLCLCVCGAFVFPVFVDVGSPTCAFVSVCLCAAIVFPVFVAVLSPTCAFVSVCLWCHCVSCVCGCCISYVCLLGVLRLRMFFTLAPHYNHSKP